MNPIRTLAAVIDAPELLSGEARPEGLGRTGLLGYFVGALGVFVWLRIYSAAPSGFVSFGLVLLGVLAFNFFMAGLIHVFLDLTGARGAAGRLFLVFGCTDYLMALLVPLAFFAKAGYLGGFMAYCLCATLLVYARVRVVRRLYAVSANKAALSVALPYAWLGSAVLLAGFYLVYWLFWLVA